MESKDNSKAIKKARETAADFWRELQRNTDLVLNSVESGKTVICKGSVPVEFGMKKGTYYEKHGLDIQNYNGRIDYRNNIRDYFYKRYKIEKIID